MCSYDWNWTDRELEARDAFIGATNQRGGVEGYLRMLALIAVHLEDDHGMGLQLAADLIAERESEYYVENTDEGRWEWFAHGVYGGAHGVARTREEAHQEGKAALEHLNEPRNYSKAGEG